jgi:hypothetical protein
MAGKGKRNLTAADLRAMDRGRTITVIPPGGGPAQIRIPKSGAGPSRARPKGRRPCNP